MITQVLLNGVVRVLTIAIIPARGGSKRIKKKNIKSFLGRPMLEICISKLKSTPSGVGIVALTVTLAGLVDELSSILSSTSPANAGKWLISFEKGGARVAMS